MKTLYLFWNFPRILTVKIGISGNARKRLKQVDKSAPGRDFLIFAFPFMPGAYYCEQMIHWICAPLRVRFRGDGHTERFLLPAVVAYFAVGGLWFLVTWGSVALLLAAMFT